jgi:DNA adenine methylase
MSPKIKVQFEEAIEAIETVKTVNTKNSDLKPFLKWAGGKRQLLPKLRELYPIQLKNKSIKNFYEPFLGSAAVFFDISRNFDINSAHLYDINEELILIYKVVQNEVYKLIDKLDSYDKNFKKLDKSKRREYFYEQRQDFNLQRFNIDFNKYSERWINRAVQAIFLNKTCFNGLFRFNSKGDFNTPAGDYENPKILDAENLLAVNQALDIAEIKKADFTEIIKDLKSNSFVYLDPPYRPISKTSSFTSYSKGNFTDKDQIKLSQVFYLLDNLGSKVMLSNSDPKNIDPSDNFFDEIYNNFNIYRIPARRTINSDSSKRGAINEIVVTNYL